MLNKIAPFFLFVIAISCSAQIKEGTKKPNIVIILADDMGYGDVKAFNKTSKIPTPNLDKIAEKGINFTNAHTSAPGCSPSRNALLYGVEPFNSGLYPFYEHEIHEQLMSQYTSLPRLLKENGYQKGNR